MQYLDLDLDSAIFIEFILLFSLFDGLSFFFSLICLGVGMPYIYIYIYICLYLYLYLCQYIDLDPSSASD